MVGETLSLWASVEWAVVWRFDRAWRDYRGRGPWERRAQGGRGKGIKSGGKEAARGRVFSLASTSELRASPGCGKKNSLELGGVRNRDTRGNGKGMGTCVTELRSTGVASPESTGDPGLGRRWDLEGHPQQGTHFLEPPDRPAAGLGPGRRPSAFEATSLHSASTAVAFPQHRLWLLAWPVWPFTWSTRRSHSTGEAASPIREVVLKVDAAPKCAPGCFGSRYGTQPLQSPVSPGARVSWVTGATHLSLTLLLCKLWKAGAPPPQSPHLLP